MIKQRRIMKVPFSVASIVLLLAGCQCSWNPNSIRSTTNTSNDSVNASTSIETQSSSDDLRRQKELQRQYEAMRSMIKRQSLIAGLKNLGESASTHSETEIRIWVGFGLAYPRCFILKNL